MKAAMLAIFLYSGLMTADAASKLDIRGTDLTFGCISGDVTDTSAVVWFRTKHPSAVSIRYGKDSGLVSSKSTKSISTEKSSDFAFQKSLTDLVPNTTYYYRAVVVDKKPGPICKFVTAPRSNKMQSVRFAFGGDVRESYKPFKIMDAIRQKQPDFFIFLGDTIYADYEGAASRRKDYWRKYTTNRKDKASQGLFSETSLYVIWDDHEVANNFVPENPLMSVGRQAFFDYWPIQREPTDPNRLYRSFRWGKSAELFVLDTRQYRDSTSETILGEKQRNWFLKALSSSDALFKFVATTVPISSGHEDKWGGFPAGRAEVLDHIVRNKISGVIFLAADVHYAAVADVPYGGGIKEIIVGPLGTKLKDKVRKKGIFDFLHYSSVNYGLVNVDVKATPPVARIEILDRKNRQLYKVEIPYGAPDADLF